MRSYIIIGGIFSIQIHGGTSQQLNKRVGIVGNAVGGSNNG